MDEETTDKPDPPSREGATTDLPPDQITVKRFRRRFRVHDGATGSMRGSCQADRKEAHRKTRRRADARQK